MNLFRRYLVLQTIWTVRIAILAYLQFMYNIPSVVEICVLCADGQKCKLNIILSNSKGTFDPNP
jgi:hypothetical protein